MHDLQKQQEQLVQKVEQFVDELQQRPEIYDPIVLILEGKVRFVFAANSKTGLIRTLNNIEDIDKRETLVDLISTTPWVVGVHKLRSDALLPDRAILVIGDGKHRIE